MAMASELSRPKQFRWRLETFMAKGPAYLYAYGRWKLLERWRRLTGPLQARRLDNAALLRALALDDPGLKDVRQSFADGRSDAACAALVAHFQTRTQPRFHFSAADRLAIISAIADHQREATLREADAICDNVFQFRHLGPVKFGAGINWTLYPNGNADWMWDLNRHAYFNTLGKAYWYTGDEKYARQFVELLLDWIDKNPAGADQPNWTSVLELGARLNNWIWAYHFFLHAEAFDRSAHTIFLKGLLTLTRQLATRLEYHVPNNHLFLEAKALAFCGVLFPEFKEAQMWRERGLHILWDQVKKQICSDGTHVERSTLYQRAVTSELLELIMLMANNNLPVPQRVMYQLEKMIDFDIHITKPDGSSPLLGDSALTDNYIRFSASEVGAVLFHQAELSPNGWSEETIWLLGAKANVVRSTPIGRAPLRLASKPFHEGGYFVMRAGEDQQALYLVFDCGPFGYKAVPNHGHADALSFELYAYGRTLIADCGAYSYYLGEPWRNYFRGSRAHNTFVVDGQDQSVLLGTRHVYRMAQATLHEWASTERFDLVAGSHDGYRRLADPVTHRRCIVFVKPEYWIVIDQIIGHGSHTVEHSLHLMPWAVPQIEHDTGTVHVLDEGDSPVLTIAPSGAQSLRADCISGAMDPIQGWISFYSGVKVAAPVVRYRQNVQLPAAFCTVLYPHRPHGPETVRVSDLAVEVDGQAADKTTLCGVMVETNSYRDICVVASEHRAVWKTFANYESNAELVYLRHRKADGALVDAALEPRSAVLRVAGRTLDLTRSDSALA
jgi:hypothetical protein